MRFKRKPIYVSPVKSPIPEAHCPSCNRRLDGATGLDFAEFIEPKSGDYTICLYCGEFLAYTERLQVRKLTEEELTRASKDPRLADLLEIAAQTALHWRRAYLRWKK